MNLASVDLRHELLELFFIKLLTLCCCFFAAIVYLFGFSSVFEDALAQSNQERSKHVNYRATY